jgi:hypothetical protein
MRWAKTAKHIPHIHLHHHLPSILMRKPRLPISRTALLDPFVAQFSLHVHFISKKIEEEDGMGCEQKGKSDKLYRKTQTAPQHP